MGAAPGRSVMNAHEPEDLHLVSAGAAATKTRMPAGTFSIETTPARVAPQTAHQGQLPATLA